MIDCGKCGSESMRLADDTYVCARCGKKYTKEMAEQREQALESLRRKRKLQDLNPERRQPERRRYLRKTASTYKAKRTEL